GPEVIPMCNAMSQGNDGSMATLHASSSRIAFTRLASYAAQGVERLPLEATNLLVASAVHFVVHLARGLDRTTRVVSSIREVVGAGLLLVIIGWRATVPTRPWGLRWSRRTQAAPDGQRRPLRIGLAVAVGVVTGVATGWVVGAALAGLAVWALPRILGRDVEHARRVARIEAIATWTEMLRDTLSAAAGLEQAILATAPLAPLAIRGEITDLAGRIENG